MLHREDFGIAAGRAATYIGSGSSVIFGLSLNEWGVIIGIAVAILGLALGQYWHWRQDRRNERIARAKIRGIKDAT